jgi:plasmid stabilization system protein ParE
MSVRIRIARRARRQIDEAQQWWREHSADPERLDREIEEAITLLMNHPSAGWPYAAARKHGVLHVLLRRTQHQIFYTLSPDEQIVEIVAFWHTSRGSGPLL